METLIKYCKKEHNIFKGCDTIRLGTLDYYREMDPSFNIADPGEATFQYTSAGNPLALSVDQMERLTDGRWTAAGDPNRPFMRAEKGGNIIKQKEFPNCYIFCTCRFHELYNKKKFAHKFNPNYDSSYMITNVSLFSRDLAQILFRQFMLEDLAESDTEKMKDLPIVDIKDIGLQIYSGSVAYVKSRELSFSQETFEDTLKNIPDKYQILFMKKKGDEDQREFRFAFVFSHPLLGTLTVKKEPKTVNLNLLKHVGQSQALQD